MSPPYLPEKRAMSRPVLVPAMNQPCPAKVLVSTEPRLDATQAYLWAETIQILLPKGPLSNCAQDRAANTSNCPTGVISVDPALAARASADGVYRGFVDAVASACASPEAEALEIAKCHLAEKRDLERHSWLKLILRVDFTGGDFAGKRGRRIALRRILDERIGAAERESDDPERTGEMAERFFITVKW